MNLKFNKGITGITGITRFFDCYPAETLAGCSFQPIGITGITKLLKKDFRHTAIFTHIDICMYKFVCKHFRLLRVFVIPVIPHSILKLIYLVFYTRNLHER